MIIGIDGTFLREPATGSGQYTVNLCSSLAKIEDSNQFYLLERRPETVPEIDRLSSANWHQVAFGGLRPSLPENIEKVLWEQVTLRRASSGLGLDLLHVPYFAGPMFPFCPTVLTIHDVIPFVMPVYRGPRMASFYWRLVARAAQSASRIITDSEASRRDIVKYLRIDPGKVQVIYLGVNPDLYRARTTGESAGVLSRLGIKDRYVLYVGGLDVRKNVGSLLRAFAVARSALEPEPKLVVVGRPFSEDSRVFPDLRPIVKETGLEHAVTFTGPVSDEERVILYQSAAAFVFPSLYEGFGLPPLEAMASGVPVIASNRSSIPEVVGDGGILVDPEDTAGIASAIRSVLQDDVLARTLRQKGLERSRQFTWEKAARETLDVYRAAVQRRVS